jgi:Holliday junction resolvasome RuvABC endonuclease subunit
MLCHLVQTPCFVSSEASRREMENLVLAAEVRVGIEGLKADVEIKSAVVGYGHATKQQVQMMIGSILKVSGPVPADAADALAADLSS